jgi:hypothetical protein
MCISTGGGVSVWVGVWVGVHWERTRLACAVVEVLAG